MSYSVGLRCLSIFFLYLLSDVNCIVPQKRLCGDAKCEEAISHGVTVILYNSPHEHGLSFKKNKDVTIYSKSYGDIWGGKVDGKSGYFPKDFVKETKVLISKLIEVELSPETTGDWQTNVGEDQGANQNESIASSLNAPESTPVVIEPSTSVHASSEEVERTQATNSVLLKDVQSSDNSDQPVIVEDSGNSGTLISKSAMTLPYDVIEEKTESIHEKDFASRSIERDKIAKENVVTVEDVTKTLQGQSNTTIISSNSDPPETVVAPSSTATSSSSSVFVSTGNDKTVSMVEEVRSSDSVTTATVSPILQKHAEVNPAAETANIDPGGILSGFYNFVRGEIEEVIAKSIELEKHDVETVISSVLDTTRSENVTFQLSSSHLDIRPTTTLHLTELPKAAVSLETTKSSISVESDTTSAVSEVTTDGGLSVVSMTTTVSPSVSVESIGTTESTVDSSGLQSEVLSSTETSSTSLVNETKRFSEKLVVSESSGTPESESDVQEIPREEPDDEFNSSEKSYFDAAAAIDELPTGEKDAWNFVKNESHDVAQKGVMADEKHREQQQLPDKEVATVESASNATDARRLVPEAVESNVAPNATNSDDDVEPDESVASDSQVEAHPEFDNTTLDKVPSVTNSNVESVTHEQNDDEVTVSSEVLVESSSSEPLPLELNVVETLEQSESCYSGNGFEGSCPKSDGSLLAEMSSPAVEDVPSASYESTEDERSSVWTTGGYLLSLRDTIQMMVDAMPEPVHTLLCDLEAKAVSPQVVVFTIIVGLLMLFLEISLVAIRRCSKERQLMTKLGKLDRIYFTVVKERNDLREKVDTFNHNLTTWKTDYVGAQETIQNLQADVESSKSEGSRLQEAVHRLQEQLDSQRSQVANLQLTSDATRVENQKLRAELQAYVDRSEELALELHQTTAELEKSNEVVEGTRLDVASRDRRIDELQQSNDQLLSEAEVWNLSVADLRVRVKDSEERLSEVTESLRMKSTEVEVKLIADSIKECVAGLCSLKKENDLDESSGNACVVWQTLLDCSSLKSELQGVKAERDATSKRLHEEAEARKEAEGISKRVVEESKALRAECEAAVLEREDATKKYEILSTYFKEKETQYQKELGIQEAYRKQSQENTTSVTMKMNLFEQEVELYRSQISSLKSEIESQERSFKNQIATHEKKAHENWLAARSAERRLEECRQEAATLRNKLTLLEQDREGRQTEATPNCQRNNEKRTSSPPPHPPGLGSNDRYDSMELPTSSGRSSLYHERLNFPVGAMPFLPVDRPLPPPFLHGFHSPPPPPPLLPPPPPLLPFDDRGPLPFDLRRGPPPDPWMPLPRPYDQEMPSPPFSSSSSSYRHRMQLPPSPPRSDVVRSPPRHDASPPVRSYEPQVRGGPRTRRDLIYSSGPANGRTSNRKTSPPVSSKDATGV